MTPRVLNAMRRVALLAITSACVAAAPAHAQLFGGDDEARQAILKLREELNVVRTEGQRGRLQLANQIENLQRQLNQIRGENEILAKQLADSLAAQRELSLGMTENRGGLPGQADAGSLLAASGEEQAAYDSAIDLFRQGSYKESASALAAFVQQYPQSGHAPTAQFYWGSSLYALRDYKSAIQQLTKMVDTWPDNQRAPDALLVIAGSQIELGNRDGARATLQRIVKDYSNSQAAGTARDRLQLLQ